MKLGPRDPPIFYRLESNFRKYPVNQVFIGVFNLSGAVMASDAFFPFPDCVEIANKSGIESVIQPGGSIKDELSINYCDENNMSMVFTGVRHFKH